MPDFGFIDSYYIDRFDLMSGLQGALRNLGYTFAVYTGSAHTEACCLSYGIEVINVHRLAKERTGTFSFDFPLTVGGYRFDSLEHLIDAERHYVYMKNWQTRPLRKRAHAYFGAASDLAAEGRLPKYAITSRPGGEVIRLALGWAAEASSVPLVFFGAFPGTVRSRLFFHDDLWHTIHQRPRPMDKPALEATPQPQSTEPVRYDGGIVPNQTPLARLLTVLRGRDFERLMWAVNSRYHRHVRFRLRRRRVQRLTADLPTRPFLFVPLNTPSDTQITLRNRRWLDMADFVTEVSRAAPERVQVCVKFHPGLEGYLPGPSMRKLCGLSNVVILPTELSASAVAKRSEAVVVINSTVGLEAVLGGTPVISYGTWNLPGLTGVWRVSDTRELKMLLAQLPRLKGFNEEDTWREFGELTQHMYPGNVYSDNIDGDALAHSLTDFLKDREVRRSSP